MRLVGRGGVEGCVCGRNIDNHPPNRKMSYKPSTDLVIMVPRRVDDATGCFASLRFDF